MLSGKGIWPFSFFSLFPQKIRFIVAAILTLTAYSEAQSTQILAAPTFYIAASGRYSQYSPTLVVKGASNLPPGSRLSVVLADYIGYKSSILSEEAIAILNRNGFFEAVLRPLSGKQFKEHMVCDISFNPNGIDKTNRC